MLINILRALPLVLFLGAAGYAGHWWIVDQKDREIAILKATIESLTKENSALELAEQEQALTIQELESISKRQAENIRTLTTKNKLIVSERDNYLSIFRKHDLTNLSRAKPGLIEPRINKGTTDIFKQIEQDTQIEHENYINPFSTPDGTDPK